jgi:hypothetical protein
MRIFVLEAVMTSLRKITCYWGSYLTLLLLSGPPPGRCLWFFGDVRRLFQWNKCQFVSFKKTTSSTSSWTSELPGGGSHDSHLFCSKALLLKSNFVPIRDSPQSNLPRPSRLFHSIPCPNSFTPSVLHTGFFSSGVRLLS